MKSDLSAESRTPRERDVDSELLHALVHDLRNHIAPIRNAVHLLRLRGGSDPQQGALLDMIERQIAGIARELDVMADAERASRGDIALETQDVDIIAAVNDAIGRSRAALVGRRQTVHGPAAQPAVSVHADPAKLAQVLDAVLDNASRYGGDDGDIRVDIEVLAEEVTMRVSDRGSGIDADYLPHVFDFLSGRTRPAHGVGLAVARRLVEAHGGSMHARSAGPGTGSELVIRLPRRSRSAGKDAAPDARVRRAAGESKASREATTSVSGATSAASGGGRRILIADDSAAVRDSLAALLLDLGHDVEGAQDGERALEIAQRWQPDFVLLDIHMPKLNGFICARALLRRK